MTTPIAITDLSTLDEATCEAWLDNLADLRSDAEDIQHHIDELNRTLAYGGIPALGLAPDACPEAIAALQEQLAATQAGVFGSRYSEAFATWAATYRPVQANPRPDAPFGGLLFDTSDEATAHVWAQPEALVWTLISEDDVLALVPGFRHCDRLGHFVCAVEREVNAPTEIIIG